MRPIEFLKFCIQGAYSDIESGAAKPVFLHGSLESLPPPGRKSPGPPSLNISKISYEVPVEPRLQIAVFAKADFFFFLDCINGLFETVILHR
jgi:hypothetical protein